MPIIYNTKIDILTSGGGTLNLDITLPVQLYIIQGNATLTSNWTIQPSGVPIQGVQYDIKWEADITLNGNTITIFGKTMPETLSNKSHEITCYYDGVDWEVNFKIDLDENGSIDSTFLSNYNFSDKEEIVTVPISFEAGELGKQIVYFPYSGGFDIHGVWVAITKDMPNSDLGFLKLYEGVQGIVPITTTLGTTIDIGWSAGIQIASAQFDLTSYSQHIGGAAITLETLKVTPGGKAMLYFLIRKH
jgi:hypothetical protein